MMLTQAIHLADTEHVVYFLLSAYVNALNYHDSGRFELPAPVKSLPLRGKEDLEGRLRILRSLVNSQDIRARGEQRLLIEAIDVFVAAGSRIDTLHSLRDYAGSDMAGDLRASTAPAMPSTLHRRAADGPVSNEAAG